MKRICLTGGIGAGKTTLTSRLISLGFVVIDADQIAHQVTEPNRPAWRALRDAFGDAILRTDQTLDRAFLADVVFHDPSALRRLNYITHGHIGEEIARQLDEAKEGVAFVDIPLFRPEHRDALRLDEVWAVLVEPETAVARLCQGRGFTERDARARLVNQVSNDERIAIVDRVIWNEGSTDELYAKLDELLDLSGVVHG